MIIRTKTIRNRIPNFRYNAIAISCECEVIDWRNRMSFARKEQGIRNAFSCSSPTRGQIIDTIFAIERLNVVGLNTPYVSLLGGTKIRTHNISFRIISNKVNIEGKNFF